MKHKVSVLLTTACLAGSIPGLAFATQNKVVYNDTVLSHTASGYAHGLTVVASPFLSANNLGDPSQNMLIANAPSIETGLHLLKQRQKLENFAAQQGKFLPNLPLIDLSGALEGQASYKGNYSRRSATDIDLTRAEFDVVAEIGPWATGAMLLKYESAPFNNSYPGMRTNQSNFSVNRAFITIGDLNVAPIYGTLGQIYVPFGKYSSAMVTDPMTKLLGRIKEKSLELGYVNDRLGATVYGFRGDSYVTNNTTINNWGGNLSYSKIPVGYGATVNAGVGYIANIADSIEMQKNIFATVATHEKLVHRVAGLDARVAINYEPFSLISEFVGAAKAFDVNDISMNSVGAKPRALDVEGLYNFNALSKKWNFALGYNESWDALALAIPKQSFFATLNTSIWDYTVESIEYRHDINYSYADKASYKAGSHSITSTDSRAQNIVTMQLGVYF